MSSLEEVERQPGLLDAILSGLGRAALSGVTFPGRYMQTYQPGQSVKDDPSATNWAADTAMNMVGSPLMVGGVPGLGAGVRTYQNVPDSLMGLRKSGPQRGFDETAYPHTQAVEITLPATAHTPRDTFVDQIRGMNPNHAYERAWRNWPDALHITPLP